MKERKRRKEEKRRGGRVVSMDRWTALSQHMWNHVSSFTAVKLEPNPSLCWPAPLFRAAHLTAHTRRHTHKHPRLSLCTHVKVITPAQR